MKNKPTMTGYLNFAFDETLHSESEDVGSLVAETVRSILDIVKALDGTELAEAIEFEIDALAETLLPSPMPMVTISRVRGLTVLKGASQLVPMDVAA